MTNKYSSEEEQIMSPMTGVANYLKGKNQEVEKHVEDKTDTKHHEKIKAEFVKELYDSETVRDKDEDIAPPQPDQELEKYQIRKPKRIILRAKLIND